MPELGKMEKPEAEQFKKGRKLFFVPLVFQRMDEAKEYAELTEKYWKEAQEQLDNLESKLTDIKQVYHEMLPNKEGIERLKHLGVGSHRIVAALLERGAALTQLEQEEILDEYMDWNRCLSLGLHSPAAFNKCYEAFTAASKKRDEYIAKHIDETLGEGEAAVIFMREGQHVQFPADIQVFYVSPPALDAVKKAQREREETEYKKHSEKHERESKGEAEKNGEPTQETGN